MSEKKETTEEEVPKEEDPWLAKLKEYPLEDLKKKGWRCRIKLIRGRNYITLVGRIKSEDDGMFHMTDRSIGPFTQEKWDYIRGFLPEQGKKKTIDEKVQDLMDVSLKEEREPTEETEENLTTETEVPENLENDQISVKEVKLPKTAKMFSTVVTRHAAIPPSISYGSDIVAYYQYFQANGYPGDINDWMHEAVRNYLAEKQIKLQIMIGKLEGM
jgi:hypothetical protein